MYRGNKIALKRFNCKQSSHGRTMMFNLSVP